MLHVLSYQEDSPLYSPFSKTTQSLSFTLFLFFFLLKKRVRSVHRRELLLTAPDCPRSVRGAKPKLGPSLRGSSTVLEFSPSSFQHITLIHFRRSLFNMMSAKRKDDLDASDAMRKRARRQDPVSCQTCRAKKLKCNRQQPCSNCHARRIECVYTNSGKKFSSTIHPTPPVAPFTRPPDPPYSPRHNHPFDACAPSPQTEELSGTLKRSEAVKTEQRLRESSEHEQTADWLETIVMGSRIPDVLPRSLKDRLMPKSASLPTPLTAFLPRETEAMEMLNHYIECMDYVYHVIILSQAQSQFNEIYQSVHNQSTVNLNYLALLFSVAAASHYFRSVGSTQPSKEAEKRSREYTALVGAALTQGSYITYPTIEGLQATIIISHCVSNIGQDPSIRAYFINATIISQALQMGLHRTDTVRNKEYRKTHGYDPVEVELKRRLWWQLASYDWYVTLSIDIERLLTAKGCWLS